MSIYSWLFGRKDAAGEAWNFVGIVEAQCNMRQEDGREVACHSYINLYETGNGLRRYEVIGDLNAYSSPASRYAHAQVRGWDAGGPLPPLIWDHEEEEQHQADLIVFPGGKDGAA